MTRIASAPVLDTAAARRLALARAGLLKPEWTGLPTRAGRGEAKARAAAAAVIGSFGYLQLDSVSVAGARSHAIVMLSRLGGFPAPLGEALLRPGEPLFEYWGHEASWMPIDLYPQFSFRREAFREHPWWGDVIGGHRGLVRDIRKKIAGEGPIQSSDTEGRDHGPWWGLRPAKRVLAALWSSGELAVRERRNFLRVFDLAERVIPDAHRSVAVPRDEALRALLLRALDGHGWAEAGTLAATWRLRNLREELSGALGALEEDGSIVRCDLLDGSRRARGWIRPADLELASRLRGVRPRADRGVLLSPFDPVLWDRRRVQRLFAFDQVLEVFKPAPQRRYGYYCLPVLAGERLVARADLKAERKAGTLRVVALHYERRERGRPLPADAEAARTALARYADALGLRVVRA
jgi:uncharacterized protein YcaQ